MKRKFHYFGLSFLIVFLTMQSIAGQNIKNAEIYLLPKDNVLTVVAVQNKSPVQFEGIEILTDKRGTTPIFNWKLKNNSSKIVKRFVVAFKIRTNIDRWRESGGGQTQYDIGTDEKNNLILPEKIYQEYDYSNSSFLPEDKLGDLFSFKKDPEDEMFIIVCGTIKKVIFDDASIYEEDNKVFSEF